MLITVISALLPIVVTLALGYLAGKLQDFKQGQSSTLNTLVMKFALPMSLFAGLMSTPKKDIIGNPSLFLWMFIGMIGSYFIILVLLKVFGKNSSDVAGLRSLAMAGPAIPFVGTSVLAAIIGTESALPIAIGSLLMNIIQVPVTLMLISSAQSKSANSVQEKPNFKKVIWNAVKEPIVWAPVLAFILVMFGLELPDILKGSFTLLGKSTGGVALFASGLTLYSTKISISKSVIFNTLVKNIAIPGIILCLMLLFKVDMKDIQAVVVSLAIPSASMCVILGIEYKTAEKEMASTLGISTIFSILTMAAFIAITSAIK